MNSPVPTTWSSTRCTTTPRRRGSRLHRDFIALQVTLTGCVDVRCCCKQWPSTSDVQLVSTHNEPPQMLLPDKRSAAAHHGVWPLLVGTLGCLPGGYVPWLTRFGWAWISGASSNAGRSSSSPCTCAAPAARTTGYAGGSGGRTPRSASPSACRAYNPTAATRSSTPGPLPAPPHTLQRAIDVLETTPEQPHTECSRAPGRHRYQLVTRPYPSDCADAAYVLSARCRIAMNPRTPRQQPSSTAPAIQNHLAHLLSNEGSLSRY